jgi:hypothetical protein
VNFSGVVVSDRCQRQQDAAALAANAHRARAFKKLDPVPQFKATAKLGEFLAGPLAKIGRPELETIPVPEATPTHKPIPHHTIVEALVETLSFRPGIV